MHILGIESSSNSSSIALLRDDELIGECSLNIGRKHSERVVPTIDWLLKNVSIGKDELDLIAVSSGPGSFTSLRVGLSVAKGMAYSLNLKVVSVSSLEILALNVGVTANQICTVTDAKRDEVYMACFENNGTIKRITEDLIIKPENLVQMIDRPTVFIGDGTIKYKEILKQKLDSNAIFTPPLLNIPRASSCALIAYNMKGEVQLDDAFSVVPKYIRDIDI